MGLSDAADAGPGIEQTATKDKTRRTPKHNEIILFFSIFHLLFDWLRLS